MYLRFSDIGIARGIASPSGDNAVFISSSEINVYVTISLRPNAFNVSRVIRLSFCFGVSWPTVVVITGNVDFKVSKPIKRAISSSMSARPSISTR